VPSTRVDQSLDHRIKERARAARRLDSNHRFEVSVGRIAAEVADELDNPAAGEHLAVLVAFVDPKHVDVHFLSEAERQLPPDVPLARDHRVPPS
jgi:hypothetical protein